MFQAFLFMEVQFCLEDLKVNIKSVKLPINQWIFNEYIKTQNLISKNIESFRFDEAAKFAYQFVWHYYCDWYLEFLKPIFNSGNKIEIQEAKLFSSFMMSNILKILHPFIPFFTESIWSMNKYKLIYREDLITSSWPNYKSLNEFNKSQIDINNIIELISNIRSSKSELKIKPKLFCDIYFSEKNGKLKKLVNKNLNLIKQTGRINNIIKDKQVSKNSIDILVLKEKLSLEFGEDVDLVSQKDRIFKKIESIKNQTKDLNNKLQNKAYVTKAPREIVQNDKRLVKELTIEEGKLRSIVSSIK